MLDKLAKRLRLGRESATGSRRREKDAEKGVEGPIRRQRGHARGIVIEEPVQNEESVQIEEPPHFDPSQYENYMEEEEQFDAGGDPMDMAEEQQQEVEEEGMEEEQLDGGFSGGPKIFSLLTDFHSHIAAKIWEGQERDPLKCHNHGRNITTLQMSEPEEE